MNTKLFRLSAQLLIGFSLAALAFAGVPRTINYQGYLKNADGSPVNTPVNVIFRLYSSTSGADAIWAGPPQSVIPVNGIYSTRITPDSLPFDRQYWLGVTINGEELRPLQQLDAAPYALRAAVAEDVKIRPGQFMYTSSGTAANASLTPRCSCDQDNYAHDCPSQNYSTVDLGAICYDVYDAGGYEDYDTGEYFPNYYSQPFSRGVSAQLLLEAGKYGGIGINTAPSSYDLDVNGTARATKFTGDGSGLTNVTATTVTGNIAGTASNVTGIVAPSNGGTGLSNKPTATGQYLRSPAMNSWSIGTIQAADLPKVYADLTSDQTIAGKKTFSDQVTLGNGVKFPDNSVLTTAKTDCTGRYEDNGDGTVTDCRSGLIWLKDANCFGWGIWSDVTTWTASLADGICGLTDESHAGDWRLPTKIELMAMVASGKKQGFGYPVITNSAGTSKWVEGDSFKGIQSHFYWTSTSHPSGNQFAWTVSLVYGNVWGWNKTATYYAWPVRAGQ